VKVTKHATLPAEAFERTIADLRVGESGWTVPWAMDHDEERRCWLNPRHTISQEPGGTVQMQVARREDGYHVWLAPDYRYHPNSNPGKGYLPVVELHEAETK